MYKYIIGLVSAVVLFSGVVTTAAYARTITINAGSLDCDSGILTDSLSATSTYSTDLCHAGGGLIVGTIPMSWGLLDGQTPMVSAGATVTDERGVTGICPWFISQGCYDLTKTFWYRLRAGYIDVLGNLTK